MIDLHCHVLPGVDDGAETLEDAVAMCRAAAADGCVAMIATPHLRRDEWPDLEPDGLARELGRLQRAVGARPRLFLGGEIRVDSELGRDLRSPGRGGVVPLAGSRYLLLELEPLGLGPDPRVLVEELRADGWRPVIAHPELTPFLAEDPELLEQLVDAGALAQVTAMSLTGEFGRPARQRAMEWIRSGRAHFVASDSHSPGWRPPGLSRAFREVERFAGLAIAQRLTLSNPLAVVEQREVEAAPQPVVQA